jgi:uroporphyrinogen-III synthase
MVTNKLDTIKSLSGVCVAVTRPTAQAKKLTQLIQNASGTVIPFPLIEISPLTDYTQFESVIVNITEYDWAIFISSNAVQNGMPRILKQGIPKHLKFAAIGPVTAKKLNGFGVDKILIPESHFDSESLLSLPEMQKMQSKKVMIVRGTGGPDVLANTLTSRGATIAFAECYQRVNPQTNCDVLEQAYARRQLHAIIVTSSEAMRHLLNLAGNKDWLKKIPILVNHPRIAVQPLKLGFKVKITNTSRIEILMKELAKLTC